MNMEKEIVGAIVIREGKILLVNNHGNWSLPGGTREENESDVECLAREFSEEFSGTKIKNIRKYDEFCGVSPRNRNPIRVRAYLAEVDGKLRQPNGTDEDVKEYA